MQNTIGKPVECIITKKPARYSPQIKGVSDQGMHTRKCSCNFPKICIKDSREKNKHEP